MLLRFINNRLAFALLLIAVILLLDQWTKWWAFSTLNIGESIPLLPFLNIVIVYNPGITFGLFSDIAYSEYLFSGVAMLIVLVLLYLLVRASLWFSTINLSLIIGGAIGNVIDRLRVGAVMDFIDLHIMDYHWPAFNIADSMIVIGVILLCIEPFFITRSSSS